MAAKPPPTSIAEALRSIRKGAAERYASDLLAQVCRAVVAVAGGGAKKQKGTLTLTFTIEPDPKTDAYLLDVSFKMSAPTEGYARTYYITDAGQLSDDPPQQDSLFPRPDKPDDTTTGERTSLRAIPRKDTTA
jgi:hypothetical protein